VEEEREQNGSANGVEQYGMIWCGAIWNDREMRFREEMRRRIIQEYGS
jgi:hypothetical protein